MPTILVCNKFRTIFLFLFNHSNDCLCRYLIQRWRNLFPKPKKHFWCSFMGGVLNINYDHLLDCLSLTRKILSKIMKNFQLFSKLMKETISFNPIWRIFWTIILKRHFCYDWYCIISKVTKINWLYYCCLILCLFS